MRLILKLVISTIAVFIAAYILPGVDVTSYTTAFVVAIVLGALNIFVKPVLLLLTLPITIVTLGLFYLIINASLVYLASVIVPGFSVTPLWMTLVFGIVVSLINSFLLTLVD